MKNSINIASVVTIFLTILFFSYQCQKEECKIYGAWNYQSILSGDTVKSVYCFTTDSMIVVFRGKKISGRLSIPICVKPNEINVWGEKIEVWPYENTCDTLILKNSQGIQTLWR